MPYVERNSEGDVIGVYANRQGGYAVEYVSDDNTAVAVFRSAPTSPPEVTIYQLRVALLRAEQLSIVETHMTGRSGDETTMAWLYGDRVPRGGLVAAALKTALSIDDHDVDALFSAASAISL